jgi:hypothetical protein
VHLVDLVFDAFGHTRDVVAQNIRRLSLFFTPFHQLLILCMDLLELDVLVFKVNKAVPHTVHHLDCLRKALEALARIDRSQRIIRCDGGPEVVDLFEFFFELFQPVLFEFTLRLFCRFGDFLEVVKVNARNSLMAHLGVVLSHHGLVVSVFSQHFFEFHFRNDAMTDLGE